MKKPNKTITIAATRAAASALLLAVPLLTGCHSAEPEGDAKQVEMTNRLDEIAKRTGGDWSKLTDDERKYLVTDISMGNEASAKMLLMGKAGKLQGHPRAPR